MSRLICALGFFAVLAATAGHSEEVSYSPDHPIFSLPAYFAWQEYMGEQSDYHREREERRSSLLGRPEGIREALRVYGWGVGTVEDTDLFRYAKFSSPRFWKISLHVFDGKAIFNQPDGTLTLIELETGKILGRIRRRCNEDDRVENTPVRAIQAGTWEQYGTLLLGEDLLIDPETAEIIDDFSYSGIKIAPPNKIVYGSYGDYREHKLTILDYNTNEKTVIMEDGRDKFTVAGELVFCIAEVDLARRKLACFSLSDGRQLWETPLPDELHYQFIVSQNDIVYVFAKANGANWCSEILSFDSQGRSLKTIPAAPKYFGGKIPDFHSYFTFMGVGHEGGFSESRLFRNERIGLWEFVAAIKNSHNLSVAPQAGCLLPDGGFAWIECDPKNAVPVLHYRDSTRSWSGIMRTVDKLMAFEASVGIQTFFAIAGDENHVVYLSNSGRLECLDRFTGQSLWIYSFPILWIDDAQGAKWTGWKRFTASTLFESRQFFTERLKYCDMELGSQGILAFLVDNEEASEQPVIITDPSPKTGHRGGALPAAIAAWTLSLVLLAAAIAIWKSAVRRLYKSLVLVAIIAVTTTTYFFLGGYSWYTFNLLRLAFWVGIILLFFPMARRRFHIWRDGPAER